MAVNKSKSFKALFWHIVVYTVVLLSLSILILGISGILYAVTNGFLHLCIDFFTSRLTSKLYAAGRRHDFFVVLGLDQFLHVVILIGLLEFYS